MNFFQCVTSYYKGATESSLNVMAHRGARPWVIGPPSSPRAEHRPRLPHSAPARAPLRAVGVQRRPRCRLRTRRFSEQPTRAEGQPQGAEGPGSRDALEWAELCGTRGLGAFRARERESAGAVHRWARGRLEPSPARPPGRREAGSQRAEGGQRPAAEASRLWAAAARETRDPAAEPRPPSGLGTAAATASLAREQRTERPGRVPQPRGGPRIPLKTTPTCASKQARGPAEPAPAPFPHVSAASPAPLGPRAAHSALRRPRQLPSAAAVPRCPPTGPSLAARQPAGVLLLGRPRPSRPSFQRLLLDCLLFAGGGGGGRRGAPGAWRLAATASQRAASLDEKAAQRMATQRRAPGSRACGCDDIICLYASN